MVGFALLGYFEANPGELGGYDLKTDADHMFAHFVSNMLPPVVSGLVLSGLFAAAMSSVDSGVNSITAVVTTDFIDRFRSKPITEAKQVRISRILAISVGLIVVVLSSLVKLVEGNFTAVTNKTVNLLTVPIFCLFFFALFVRFATPAWSLDRRDLWNDDGGVDRILRPDLWVCRREWRSGSDQLSMDRASDARREHQRWLFCELAPEL